jgi:pimeloyl-ACP methyl ester carboxylesterase
VLLGPGSAAAQTAAPMPCPRPLSVLRATCGHVQAPADHTGRVAGVQRVAFARFPASGASRGTLTVLPGGPGEAALGLAGPLLLTLGPILVDHDLLLVDPRGTGLSDATGCRVPQSATATPAVLAAVAACGERLGARRATLTTAEQVRDLEDVRAALGIPRLTLLGASYGTKVAAEYVRRFPASTDRVVLDSPVPVDGLDADSELPSLALPRVMREVCWPPGCRALAGDADPQRMLARLVARLQRRAMTGRFVGASGAIRRVRIDTEALYTLLLSSDAEPLLRVDVPAAMRAALDGDPAYLARLIGPPSGAPPAPDAGAIDVGRFLASLCVESRLPWRPDAPLAGRREALLALLTRDAARFLPFPPGVVAAAANATACLTWPATPPPEPVATVAPPVPTLILSGREDLRTPVEDARRTAAQYPDVRLLAVPDVGHSVLVNDPRRCALRGVASFLAGGPVAPCARGARPLLAPAPFVPADVDRLPGAPGVPGRAGRTATAVAATLLDTSRQALRTALNGRSRSGGLRGGTLAIGRGVTLRSIEVVRGVRVSGTLRVEGTTVVGARLTVTGPAAAPGVVSLRGRRLTGTLGGRRIDERLGAAITA